MEEGKGTLTGGGADLDLPGFRFHPTDEELLDFYLRRTVTGKRFHFEIIPTVHLYRYDPADLPGLAKIGGGEREWYFFVPRDRKQGNGGRPNRTTARGFWKATGCDRPIRSGADPKRLIGLKKTLVFYRGRAPRGTKTDWVMNEYRLPDTTPLTKEDIVLCKIYQKATSLKELEQRAAIEAGMRVLQQEYYPSKNTISFSYEESYNKVTTMVEEDEVKEMNYELLNKDVEESSLTSSLQSMSHEEVKLQRNGNLVEDTLEWLHDPFFTQLHSPLMDQCWPPYSNAFSF